MRITQFPAQKKTLSEKTEKWGIECVEAGVTITTGDSSKVRKSRAAKKINFDLIDGIIDEKDIEHAFNPMGIRGVNFPAKIQNYPIEVAKFNVLKGEESKRRFDWRVRSVNEDAISKKEFDMGEQVKSLIAESVQDPNYNEEQAARRLRQLQHYQNYDYQDFGEVMGSRIIEYFWYTQKLKETFSSAFYDVLVGAEEIYGAAISHGEPMVEKENTLGISTFGMGNSHKIENSDIIVSDQFVSTGKVIDEFWKELSDTEIDELEEGARRNRWGGEAVPAGPWDAADESLNMSNSQLITVDGSDLYSYTGNFDTDGNIRVIRVVWKSRRKIGMLTYFDEEGTEQSTIVDENFPIKNFEGQGWTIDWHWINEWWQGYRIGHDMYKRIEPLPRIGTKMSNPSICLPPYVGTVYRIGGTGISLMDRVKPYKYLYNVYMRRTELASARNKGRIAELDLAEIPDGWDEELVMMYAEANGYMIKDSFKEGKKGNSTGKLVGTVKQRGSDVLQLDSADVIRANLELARYVKAELAEVAGVSPQREGEIGNRETKGGAELAITNSSHVTEEWFSLHDNTKLRVLELLVETAKHAWRYAEGDAAKKLQYVDDGLITQTITVDGRRFAETEYGYYVSDGRNDAELIGAIKTLAQAALQNDKATFKDIFSIYRDTSVASMVKKLEASEQQANEREDDARREALESQEKVQEAINQLKQMEMEQKERIEMNKIQAELIQTEMEITGKLQEAEMKMLEGGDTDKIQLELTKLNKNLEQKRKEMIERSEQFYAALKSQEKRTGLQIKSSEKIARMRPAKQKA